MTSNVGMTDRILRVLIGGSLASAAAFGAIGPWGLIGLVPFITGLLGYCPVYSLFRRGA